MEVKLIYLDNAATTFPKPKEMVRAMASCLETYCGNPGRSGHSMSMRTAEEIFKARVELCELLGIEDGERIIFTSNATESLNLAIKGILHHQMTNGLRPHIITTAMEHNSVLRPLKELENQGAEITIIPCAKDGTIDVNCITSHIRANTRLIVCTHASNVTGTIMPIEEIGKISKSNNIPFLVDASQTVGAFPMDIKTQDIDLLVAPGHKSLLGPQGTGILYVKEGIHLHHLKHGGTGTYSQMLDQPADYPDGYEAGTINAPGIIGLGASVKFINKIGVENIKAQEEEMLYLLDTNLRNMKNIICYGPTDTRRKTAIITVNVKNKNCEEVARILNTRYNIAVRAGFHCAPFAHKTIGTDETGALRMSIGAFTSKNEIKHTINAMYEIQKDNA